MSKHRLGPQQRALAQAIHDGARLYRTTAGWYTEHRGVRTKQGRERCSGMVVRGVLVLDGTDELSNGESRDRYVLSEEGKRALRQYENEGEHNHAELNTSKVLEQG